MPKDLDQELIIRDIIVPVQEYFAANSKITCQFYSGGGKLLTPEKAPTSFELVLQKSREGRQHLRDSRNAQIKSAIRLGRPSIGVCSFTGLLQACVPALLQKDAVGCWVLGQTLLPRAERSYGYYDQYLSEISAVIGLHLYPLRKLLYELPEVPQDAFIETVSLVDGATQRLLRSWQKRADAKTTGTRQQPHLPPPGAAG